MQDEKGKTEFDSVHEAKVRKFGPSIISTNLDAEFSAAKEIQLPLVPPGGNPVAAVRQAMRKRGAYGFSVTKKPMNRTAGNADVNRVYDVPYNPFRQRLTVETPRNITELNARYRYYAKYESLVGAAIELHTQFPISDFNIDHEDKEVTNFFNSMMERLDMFNFLTQMVSEYWTVGEAIPYGFLDDPYDPTEWDRFILLNPDNVSLESHPMIMGERNYNIFLTPDAAISKIVAAGPGDEKTGSLYKQIPLDVIEACKSKKPMQLNDLQVSHFKRQGDPFNLRGESLLTRILHIMAYRDKLREAQYSICDRHLTPREIYCIGDKDQPADEEELQNFADLLAETFMDPNQAIVWHHALNPQVIGTADKVMPLRQEFTQIEEEMLTGLMISKAFTHSEGPTYSNASVALDVLISKYVTLRNHIEQWMNTNVFGPMCVIHDLYKPTQAEVSHRIRTRRNERPLWLPKVKWVKADLRNNENKVKLLQGMMEKGLYPKQKFFKSIDEDYDELKRMLREEKLEAAAEAIIDKGLPKKPTGKPGDDLAMDIQAPDTGGGGEAPEAPEPPMAPGEELAESPGSPLNEIAEGPNTPVPPGPPTAPGAPTHGGE